MTKPVCPLTVTPFSGGNNFFASDSPQGEKRAIIITVKGTHTFHISSYFLSNFFVVPVFLYFSVHTAPVFAGAVFFMKMTGKQRNGLIK